MVKELTRHIASQNRGLSLDNYSHLGEKTYQVIPNTAGRGVYKPVGTMLRL